MADTFVVPVEVRYSDLDTRGHVNNAVYATYLEEARKEFYSTVVGVPFDEVPTVLARQELVYHDSITIADDVTVAVRPHEPGGSSITIEYDIRVDDTLAASAETVQVVVDESGASTAVPDAWRRAIDDHRTG